MRAPTAGVRARLDRWVIAGVVLLGLGPGCGPGVTLSPMADGSSGSEGTTGLPSSSTGPIGPTPSSTSGAPESTSTSAADTDGSYEEDDGGTGCTFTCPPAPTTGGGGFGCSLTQQDCPEGEKCMPWANDGGMEWNSIRCSPVAEAPGQPGDPCTVEGSQWSGLDDCDVGVMCLGVDPKTNEGICGPICVGGAACGPDQECEIQPGDLELPLCVPACDPTAPDCIAGEGCFPLGSSFTCQPMAEAPVPVGSPCSEPAACDPGSLCAFVGLDCGQAAGDGCCAPVCDTTQPNPCGPGVGCMPWFGAAAEPQWAHVGYCAP